MITYTVENGLPSNLIYYMLQDRNGYIWIGTNNGVCRFDGVNFKTFSSRNGLPDNDIVDIREDATGRLWVSCYNGELAYIKGDIVFSSQTIPWLAQMKGKGYPRFTLFRKKLVITHSLDLNSFEIGEDGHITPIANGKIAGDLLSTGKYLISGKTELYHKLILYDSSYQKCDSIIFRPSDKLYNQYLCTIAIEPDSFMLCMRSGTNPVYYIRNGHIVFSHLKTSSQPIQRCYRTINGYWVNTDGYHIAPADLGLKINNEQSIHIKDGPVNHLFIDREGNKWIATSGNGILLLINNQFTYYYQQEGLKNSHAAFITHFNNGIYIACNNSLLQRLGDRKLFRLPSNNKGETQNKITCLLAEGDFIIAGRNGSLEVKNLHSGAFEHLEQLAVKCLAPWKKNYYLMGCSSWCYGIRIPGTVCDTILHEQTLAVCALSEDTVLAGNSRNLYVCYKDKSGKWHNDNGNSFPSLQGTVISAIAKCGNILAIGSIKKGLLVIKGRDTIKIDMDTDDLNFNCRKIVAEDTNTLWIGTYSGLYKVTLGGNIRYYSVDRIQQINGLLSNYVSDFTIYGDSIFVANSTGIVCFSKTSWNNDTSVIPSISIKALTTNKTTFANIQNGLKLPYGTQHLQFSFLSIDYRSKGHIRYKYRLLGNDSSWHNTTTDSVIYEALPAGNYRFEVQAMNTAGMWTKNTASLSFTILPPWWNRIEFRLLIILGCLFSVFLLARKLYSIKHLAALKVLMQKKMITELELKAIKAQINPHFLFNALNSIQYFINTRQEELADKYLTHLAALLRDSLDLSSRIEISVAEEIEFIENYLYLERLRFDEHFSFTIECEPKPAIYNASIPAMVLQPHIENALKHGLKQKNEAHKTLRIRLYLTASELICEIEDNGPGRNKSTAMNKPQSKDKSVSGTSLSANKLAMYSVLSGTATNTEIIDLYDDNDKIHPSGTLIRITIAQKPYHDKSNSY